MFVNSRLVCMCRARLLLLPRMLCCLNTVRPAGRSETMVEYDVGFKASGEITALKIRGYFLCGAFLDLGFNDMMVLQQGVDQVGLFSAPPVPSSCALLGALCLDLGGGHVITLEQRACSHQVYVPSAAQRWTPFTTQAVDFQAAAGEF